MSNNLYEVLTLEEKKLRELLSLLDKQYKLILNKDIFGMEAIVEEIKVKNKEVAEIEVDRRRFLGHTSIKDYILNSNNSNLDNKNTILYAHSRLDKTMFGSLSKVLNSNWYTNKDNQVIKLSTPQENTLWRMFSTYTIPAESYYIQNSFKIQGKHRIPSFTFINFSAFCK